jgi:hypothetical protein
VIFEEAVAMEYLSIMQELDVKINMTKSVLFSRPGFEFAKVTGLIGINVSALS